MWQKIASLTLARTYLSTTPLRQWGFWQCLLFCWTTLRGKHCRHPIAVMGVVNTFGHCSHYHLQFQVNPPNFAKNQCYLLASMGETDCSVILFLILSWAFRARWGRTKFEFEFWYIFLKNWLLVSGIWLLGISGKTILYTAITYIHSQMKCLGGVPVLWSKWPLASSLLQAIKTCHQACPPGYLMYFS